MGAGQVGRTGLGIGKTEAGWAEELEGLVGQLGAVLPERPKG